MNIFNRAPVPSIKTEINKIQQAEMELQPARKALLEKVRESILSSEEWKTGLDDTVKIEVEQDIRTAEEVRTTVMFFGTGEKYEPWRLKLSLMKHYDDGQYDMVRSTDFSGAEDIFRSMEKDFGQDRVNMLRKTMILEEIHKSLNETLQQMREPLDEDKKGRLEKTKSMLEKFLRDFE